MPSQLSQKKVSYKFYGQSRNEELSCNHLQQKLKEVHLAFYKEENNKETYCIHFKQKFT